ncbi:hypothetical protein ACM64Y_08855 [Novispirillum sp. DQ9]|uniref:hypothetical protein n=1 Tax=Novispirillum sp. DQ9 TaxID=3398612 RepID=UPI003C7DCAEC
MADTALKIALPEQPAPMASAPVRHGPLTAEESHRHEVRRRVSLAVDHIRTLARQTDA